MKLSKKVWAGVSIFAAAIVMVMTISTQTKADSSIVHPVQGVMYKENPTPELQGNMSVAQSSFLTKEQAIQMAYLPQDAELVSAVLIPWEKHVTENLKGQGGYSEVSKDRMVWVIHAKYPNGVDTKGGFYANATRYIVFDAETGRILNVMTTGDLKTSYGQNFNK